MPFADLPIGAHAQRIRSHWWWRPGWSIGRQAFAWHITFEGDRGLHRLIADYQRSLRGLTGVDPIPAEWLHLTMQGIGFTDEVSSEDLEAILDSVRNRFAEIEPVHLTFHSAFVGDEAVALPPVEEERIIDLRRIIRAEMASLWGAANIPEDEIRYRPHVSAAYFDAEGDASPYVEAVRSIRPGRTEVTISKVALIALNRDDRMYKWKTYATTPLGY